MVTGELKGGEGAMAVARDSAGDDGCWGRR